jgi:hypothetical protein
MDWSDQLAAPAQPEPAPAASGGHTILGPARRTIATLLLAVGLLAVGGVAVVFAADPSATPAPSATTQPSTGGSGGTVTPRTNGQTPAGGAGHVCPDKGTGGTGSGGAGSSAAPSTPSTDPTTAPSAEL